LIEPTIAPRPELTHTEREVLALLVEGKSPVEIAAEKQWTQVSVKNALSSAYRKLGVRTRQGAVKRASQLGLF